MVLKLRGDYALRVHNPPAVREDEDMKKSGKLKCFLGVLTLMICLFLISPVYAMAEGHLRVATISGRAFQKGTCEKMTAILKKQEFLLTKIAVIFIPILIILIVQN